MYCENLEAMGYFYQYVSRELQDNAYDGKKNSTQQNFRTIS